MLDSKPPGMKTLRAPARRAVLSSKSCVTPAGMRRKVPADEESHSAFDHVEQFFVGLMVVGTGPGLPRIHPPDGHRVAVAGLLAVREEEALHRSARVVAAFSWGKMDDAGRQWVGSR